MMDIAGVIIAGGFGTRLRPLTYTRPKHLLPVANRPFLEYQVALLRRSGIREVVFATNYFAEQIEAHFGDGSRFGVSMRYALEREPLGTAGAVRNAAKLAPGNVVLALNGDILTDFDLRELIDKHRERHAAATIALRPVERPHAFGVLETEMDGRITAWREPSDEEKRRVAANPGPKTGDVDYINAGVYILEGSVIEAIPSGRPVSIERETYPALIGSGAAIFGHAPGGFWMDIGNPTQYRAANVAVLTGAVKTDAPFRATADGAEVAAGAEVDRATAIGARVSVGNGSRLSECILMDGVKVGANAQLTGLVAEPGVVIGDEVVSRPGVVLASGTVVARGSIL